MRRYTPDAGPYRFDSSAARPPSFTLSRRARIMARAALSLAVVAPLAGAVATIVTGASRW